MTAEGLLGGRYVLQERLGVGGYGEVYAAFDHELTRRVALKRMRSFYPEHLLRFKREFRALSGISHPNLVCLYDLFADQGDYYLSMELVEGVSLVEFVRGAPSSASESDSMETCDAPIVSAELRREHASGMRPLDGYAPPLAVSPLSARGIDRARTVFPQLADALTVLHAGGMVHRDLKPSNVLVTKAGRVVVLDFGLVTDVVHDRVDQRTHSMLGTPYYMSPEQANADPVGPAADLYAVGVMLYETMIGVTPFEGLTTLQAVVRKLSGQVPDVRALAPHLPRELADLCMELVHVDPSRRPDASDVRQRLGANASGPAPLVTPSLATPRFVGRDDELARMRDVHASVTQGNTGFLVLEGESGMGKSALADRFLGWADESDRSVVLRGRCYEHDSLPNKLLDSVVDSLSAHLSRVPESLRRSLLPVDIAELVRIFPVLGRIDEIADRSPLSAMRDDPREARRFAELAFAELLGRLGEIRPVVVYIDDVHWGDVESLGFLRALLAPRTSRRVMVLFACRVEEKTTSPLLRALFASVEAGEIAKPTVVEIGRLSAANSEALALALANDSRGARLAALVAREGRGHPLFIEELVRYVRANDATPRGGEGGEPGSGDLGRLLLADVIVRRVESQAEDAVRVLRVLAVVGVPIAPRVVFRALGESEVDATMLHRLRAEHLVRRSGADDDGLIVCYHDRIRESLLERLSIEQRRSLHRGIATSLEREDGAAPALLATHCFGAGDLPRASEYAFSAGEQAYRSLAFGEAATFFERSLKWDASLSERRTRTYELLGDALLNLGRCRDAANAYLVAADVRRQTDPRAARRLRTRASEANLLGGDEASGDAMMRELLEEVGSSVPDTELRRNLRIGWSLVRLGTRLPNPLIVPRPTSPEATDRIDVLFAAQRSYVFRDFPRSLVFAMEGFREALRAGEPNRVMEGVAFYAAATSLIEARGAPLVMQATFDLAEKLGTDFAFGVAHFARGHDLFARHHLMRESQIHFRKSVDHFGRCADVTPLRVHVAAMEVCLLRTLEDFDDLRQRCDETMRDARVLGNDYVEACARHDSSLVHLASDEPDIATARIESAIAAVPVNDFYVRFSAIQYRSKCHRYVGEWDRAVELIESSWGILESQRMISTALGRFIYGGVRAGSLVGLAAHEPKQRAALVKRARRAHAPFKKATSEWSVGYGALLDAAIASLEGNAERAAARCLDAARSLEAGRLPVFAESARFRAAQLACDDAALAASAQAMNALGVKRPAAWVDSVAPGFLVGAS